MDLTSAQTTIYLVRHGETDWNATGRLQGQEDVELNANGQQQALSLAKHFSTVWFDVIISSDLKRAYQTAQLIAKEKGNPSVEVIHELRERCYGSASGLLPEERKAKFPDGIIPDQEDFEVMRLRAMTALDSILKTYPNQNVLVISHGGLINSILYSLSAGEFGSFKTRLKNACINKITHQNNTWTIEYYNQTV